MQEIRLKSCTECKMYYIEAIDGGVQYARCKLHAFNGFLSNHNVAMVIGGNIIHPNCLLDNNELITYKIVKNARD